MTKKKEKPINSFTCPTRISLEKLHEMFEKLNNEQREFAMHELHFFKLDRLPLKTYLSGSAGVGKSYLINLLYQLITNHFDNEPGGDLDKMTVLLTAPSGKVSFSLPLNQYGGQMPKLSSDVANQIRSKLMSVKLIIMDEVSMIGSRTFNLIDVRLRQITGINKPFGNISIIVVGDFMQLPPVRDRYVFQLPNNHEYKDLFDRNPLWDEFSIYELTQIMRQKGEAEFINALNNLAVGKMTEEDIKLVKSCEVKNLDDIPKTAIRLYATNAKVNHYSST
ncbi:ATP-dependent DNA helicase PIF1-like [Chrysoperla carnea]|uniref:ATP-dependent DNA helicase PIF1-like n=1 Tax=Chrysoperla carnea TaxID=189513 RepID=UPI001D07317F|nr:ATP-dependent DNA helicase PIF1-like [Chrysoperla carnea]